MSTANSELDRSGAARGADWLAPLAVLAIAILMTTTLILGAEGGRPGEASAVIFPPWWSQERAFDAVLQSGALVASAGPTSWILIAAPQDDGDAARLLESGALAVFGARVARFCGA